MKTHEAVGGGRAARWMPAIVAAVCLAPFLPLVTRQDAVVSQRERDYAVMHVPLAEFVREELLAGRMPLWNPFLACGQPLPAAQQAMLFYPLSTPVCLVFGANRGLEISLFAHLGLCYAGTYLLARRAKLSPNSAAYAALVMSWSGALMGNLAEGHIGGVFETALAPWSFLALMNLLRSPTAMTSVCLAAVGAMCVLASQPQVFYYIVVAGASWAAGSLCGGEAACHRARAVCFGALAAVIALLLAAVQLVPVAELMREGLSASQRGTATFAVTYALDGADSARLLMPYLNGTPFAGVPQFDGADHYHERVIYLGLAAPVLAVYGLSRFGASKWQWAAAWGIVLALAVAFGDNTPAFGLLGRILPGLQLFRCPGRVFSVASLPAALLAGRGLDALARGEPRAGPNSILGLAAVALAGLNIPVYAALRLAPTFDWQRYAQYASENLIGDLSLWAVLAVETAAILALAAVRRLRGPAVWLPLVVVAGLDLGYFNVGNFRMDAWKPLHATIAPPGDGTMRFVESAAFGHISERNLRYSHLTRAAMIEHRPTVATYDGGVLPAATARLYKSVEANAKPALALAACGFAWSSTGVAVEHPEGALPRIRFVPEGSRAIDLPLEAVSDADIRDLRRHLVPVVSHEAGPRELEMELTAPAGGWLVVADVYYPGWICRMDGQPWPIERAHGVFRRVRVEAGRHRIVMSYEPPSFRVDLSATFAGVVIAAALSFFGLATRPRASGGE